MRARFEMPRYGVDQMESILFQAYFVRGEIPRESANGLQTYADRVNEDFQNRILQLTNGTVIFYMFYSLIKSS